MAVKHKDMAIRYKELVKKQKEAPLTPEELKRIEGVEAYIDKKILAKDDPRDSISIELRIADFRSNLDETAYKYMPYSTIRTSKMHAELERRYKEAGWTSTVHIDDGLDGPNMSGPDYWVLKGK
jgi:hypothetical protein